MSAWALALAVCLSQFEGPVDRREPEPEPQGASARQLVGTPRSRVPQVVVDELSTARPVPSDWALPGYRVHVFASEELPVDALRRLVRPGVTLWLQTRSNMLRGSTVDTLRRADAAWVQLRPPVLRAHWEQLARVPRVGTWVDAAVVSGSGMERRGPHPLALEILAKVPLERLIKARPGVVLWRVPASPAEISAVRAEHVVWEGISGDGGCAPKGTQVKARLDAPWKPPCGAKVLAQVIRPDTASLRSLYVAEPAAELVAEVQDSESAARGVAKLLDLLDEAVGRAERR